MNFDCVTVTLDLKPIKRDIQRLIKSTCGVYCNIMFHVAEAKIIRHTNMVLDVETLAHFSVPKRKSVGKKWSIGIVRYTTMVVSNNAAHF